MGEIAASADHGERAKKLPDNNDGKTCFFSFVSSFRGKGEIKRTKDVEPSRMLPPPPLLREVALLNDVFKNPSDMRNVISIAVVQEVRCEPAHRQLRSVKEGVKVRTLNRQLPRVVHARNRKLEEMKNRPTREVRPELGTLGQRRVPPL